MTLVFDIAHHSAVRLAEIGFLCFVIGGLWLAATQLPQLRLRGPRTVVAGLAFVVGGVLLIIAVHWGRFG